MQLHVELEYSCKLIVATCIGVAGCSSFRSTCEVQGVDGGTILEDKQTPLRCLLKHHLLPLWRRLHEAVITRLITVQSYVGLEDLYRLFPQRIFYFCFYEQYIRKKSKIFLTKHHHICAKCQKIFPFIIFICKHLFKNFINKTIFVPFPLFYNDQLFTTG